jgi:hypothetical protein
MKRWVLGLAFVVLLGEAACRASTPVATIPTPTFLPLPSATASPAPSTVPVATPVIIASATFTSTPVTHVVEQGDTLISVAVKYGVSLEALQAANPTVQPHFLSVGTVLIIPLQEGSAPNANLAPTPVPIPFSTPVCYPTPTEALYCFVEAHNSTDVALENVSARVTLAGPDGMPLVSGVVYSALDVIPPGSAAPLGILFPAVPATPIVATGVLALSGNPLFDPSAHHISLDIPAHHGTGSGNEWTVTGQIRNPSATPAASAWLVLTLYDQSRAIVGYRKQPLEGGLAAGAAQDFSISAASLNGAIDHYRIAAEGRP